MKIAGKFALLLIFSISSLGAFADPHGRDRHSGPGDRERPSPPDRNERSALSGNRPNERPSNPRSFSAQQEPDFRPAPPMERNTALERNIPEFPPQDEPFSSSENGRSDEHQNEGSGKLSSEILYYRGSRILSKNDEFLLQDVKTVRLNPYEINLELTFNQSINPLTFSTDSILLNGESISTETKFAFNKKGDTIRIAVPVRNENFNLTITALKSYDGTPLEPVSVEIKD